MEHSVVVVGGGIGGRNTAGNSTPVYTNMHKQSQGKASNIKQESGSDM